MCPDSSGKPMKKVDMSTLFTNNPLSAGADKAASMTSKSQIVIVSNRLPVNRVIDQGDNVWATSPGGLVSALTPILKKHPSTWIGWPGFAGDAPESFTHDGIRNLPISLSEEEVRTFYEGFSNRTLWPLYHDAVRPPEYRRRWWKPYVQVNRRFAIAAAETADKGGMVWVHDYQLQLVPAMLRELRPDLRIGFFLHIPFPPQELFAQMPWRQQIIEGLLGADVIGCQTRLGAENFTHLAQRFAGATSSGGRLKYNGRILIAREFPISIDVNHFEQLAASEAVLHLAEEYRIRLGPLRRIMLGVDRLDYTKGIDIRLRAYQELLRSGRILPSECVLVQVAVPSRERVAEYQELRGKVEQLVGEINGEFGELGRTPVHYLHRNLPPEELVALYRAADVMLVTPFRDGMNLVAKEYVASRVDNRGALVLSEFTGAAKELTGALLINPHDIDGMADTIEQAFRMPQSEQTRRMKILRKIIRDNDVYHWANSFTKALAE